MVEYISNMEIIASKQKSASLCSISLSLNYKMVIEVLSLNVMTFYFFWYCFRMELFSLGVNLSTYFISNHHRGF